MPGRAVSAMTDRTMRERAGLDVLAQQFRATGVTLPAGDAGASNDRSHD